MNVARDAIVVAVGVDGAKAALQYAVIEARRTGRPVHLVHVLQLPGVQAYVGGYSAVMESSRAVLDEALDTAAQLAGEDVSVTGHLIDDGWVVDDLVRGSVDDRMLVLQHRAFNPLHRLVTGSIVQGVAGRAHVPVVSVPEGWTPGTSTVVTAAVQEPVEAPGLLRIAFEEARTRSQELVVLHAWWLASGFDVAVVDETIRSEWAERSRAELEPALRSLRAEFPDVRTSVEIRHAPPVEAILDAARTSDLVVMGRRHHRLPLASHLGPVVRAAIAHASSPVMVTPELVVPGRREAEPTRPYRSDELTAYS
jgi:nucleotide-binding universal stress UspA family protein